MSNNSLIENIELMIQNNKINYDYINILTSVLTSKHKSIEQKEITRLIYSNVSLFEDVFNNITSNTLYILGNVFNNNNGIKLIELIKSNKNINHIKIQCCYLNSYNNYINNFIYLYTLNSLKDIKISFITDNIGIELLYNNKHFKKFINNHTIYNFKITCYSSARFTIVAEFEDIICDLIYNNKIVNLKLKDYTRTNIYLRLDSDCILSSIYINSSLKTIQNNNLIITDKLYKIFKNRNLLSSFIHYENKYDYNTYYMSVNSLNFNIDNLCDLIQENEKVNYNKEFNRYEYIFDNLYIEYYSFNELFYELLKNSNNIKKLFFKNCKIDCNLLADALINNNTIKEIYFDTSDLINFDKFADVIQYNKSIINLNIHYSCYSEKELNKILETLKYNDTLTSLYINGNIDLNSINILCNSLKVNDTITNLNVIHSNKNHCINQINDIIQYNNTIQNLSIISYNCLSSEYNHFKPSYEEMKRLNSLLKVSKNLEKINLEYINLDDECYNLLLDALKYNKSLYSINLPLFNHHEIPSNLLNEVLDYNSTLIEIK